MMIDDMSDENVGRWGVAAKLRRAARERALRPGDEDLAEVLDIAADLTVAVAKEDWDRVREIIHLGESDD